MRRHFYMHPMFPKGRATISVVKNGNTLHLAAAFCAYEKDAFNKKLGRTIADGRMAQESTRFRADVTWSEKLTYPETRTLILNGMRTMDGAPLWACVDELEVNRTCVNCSYRIPPTAGHCSHCGRPVVKETH